MPEDALGARLDSRDHEQVATSISVFRETFLRSGIIEMADHRKRALTVTKVATEPFTDARSKEQVKPRTVVIPRVGFT
jgi:hypothetical protein